MKKDGQSICPERLKDALGFTSMFDVAKEEYVLEGTVLAVRGQFDEDIILFQLAETISIFGDRHVTPEMGSMIWYDGDIVTDISDDVSFSLENCRYPTQEEFDWYNKQELI